MLEPYIASDLHTLISEYHEFTGINTSTLTASKSVSALTGLGDGRIISGTTDGHVQVWRDDQCEANLRHCGYVRCLSVFNNLIISGCDDMNIRLWDVNTHVCTEILLAHTNWIRCVNVLYHHVPYIMSGGDDRTIRLWNSTTLNCVSELGEPDQIWE